ncbi:hypothetical protein ACI2LF_24150 [Kribbella sp. NPDC020789]
MGDRKRRRRELLHRQAAALEPFLGGAAGSLILCPLCLRLYPEADWPQLSLEDAPPQQYGGGTQRCMTCQTGNNLAGGSFETTVARLNSERSAALRRATPPRTTTSGLDVVQSRLLLPFSTAFHLASVQDDEKQLELKSAYLIAYATLGHSYILGAGLEQVRELIRPGADLTGVMPCARLRGLPAGDKVFVMHAPIECLVVSHPTRHLHDDTGHAVLLPLPDSAEGFYSRLQLMPPQASWAVCGEYDQPPARRLPMHWDTENHHARSNSTFHAALDGVDVSIRLSRQA